jgi:NADPH:quinone reductase-like Zn-dependent oxidoreductase
VKTEPLAPIPDGVTDDQAVALPIAAITALRSLELLGVTPGQRLVVMGATGAVGGYTVQMARDRGVRVIATVRRDADEARRLGADEVYDAEAADVIDALRASHPDGVEAVLDLVNGSSVIRRDAEILKSGGGLVSTRYAADEEWFAERRITAVNIATLTNPLSSPEGLAKVARMLAHGTITARIHSIIQPDQIGEVFEKLRNGGLHGKAVIRF